MKRILSVLLCLSMVLGLMPMISLAATYPVTEPEWSKAFVSAANSDNLISDYKFTGSDVYGEYIPNSFDGTDFKSEYTNQGFKITKTSEPTESNRATQGSQWARVNFVSNSGIDSNGTMDQQFGFSGSYIVDIGIIPNLSMPFTSGNAIRLDCDFGSSTDIDSYKISSNTYNQIRITSNNDVTLFHDGNAYTSSNSRRMKVGQENTVRYVFDTVNHNIAMYLNSLFVGSCTYGSDIIQCLRFNPRLGFSKGSSITLTGVKIYEIERANDFLNETVDSIKSQVPGSLVPDYTNVTSDIDLPEISVGKWLSTNADVITTSGKITRGYEDEKVALRIVSKSDLPFFKTYNLVVKAQDNIVKEDIIENDYTDTDNLKDLVYEDDGDIFGDFDGLVIRKSGVSDSSLPDSVGKNAVGILKSLYKSDTYSNTYASDYNGVYDLSIGLIPALSGVKPAKAEIGNYNPSNGTFTSFASFNVTSDGIGYITNSLRESVTAINEYTSGNYYKLKFRIDTENSNLWFWINDNKGASLGTKYNSKGLTLNAFRVSIDDNVNSGDYITLCDSKLTKLLNVDNNILRECLSASDDLLISNVSSTPDDAYGRMGSLPDSVGSYTVDWSTESQYVDLQNKYIYRSENDQNIIVSAKLYKNRNPEIVVTKDFRIKVAGTSDLSLILEGSVNKIRPENITKQDSDAIYTDLLLPSVTEDGHPIAWTSLNPDIISDTGIINKTINISEPTQVTLRASVSGGGSVSINKDIKFNVAKRGADVLCYTDTSSVDTSIGGIVTYQAVVSGTSGSAYLEDDNGNSIIGLTVNGSKISFDYNKTDRTKFDIISGSLLKFVLNLNNNEATVYIDGIRVLDCVPYIGNTDNFKSVTASGITLSDEKIILDEYSLFDYNIKKFDYFSGIGNGFISGNINLADNTSTYGGTQLEWKSSDSSILKNDGTYTAPESTKLLDITFNMSMVNGTDAVYEKVITCIAEPDNKVNLFNGKTYKTSLLESLSNPVSYAFDNNQNTYFNGKIRTNSYIQIDMGSAQDIDTLTFNQINDETGIKTCDVSVSNDGSSWTEIGTYSFSDINSCVVSFPRKNVRYVRIGNITADSQYINLYELKGYKSFSLSDKSMADILAIDMPAEYKLTADSINLPSIGPVYGSTLTWSSSNSSVISANGVVSRPLNNTEVILTVKSEYEGVVSTKTYRYLVQGTSGSGSGGTSAGGSGGGIYSGNTSLSALPSVSDYEQQQVSEQISSLFSDVNSDDWYYSYLAKLKKKDIIQGAENNMFYPNNYVTREEFVKMIVVGAGIDLAESDNSFNDVDSSDWFAPYVYAAKSNGIVNGIETGRFGVGNPISRQDMSVIIYNLIKISADISKDSAKFTDDMNISDYALDAVYTMKALGVINGYDDGSFNPYGQLTRAEAAKVIAMVIDMI